MPSNSFNTLMDKYWDKSWNKLKCNVQLTLSHKENWQNLIPVLEQISLQNSVFVMIYNLITNRIIYTADKRNISGYDASLYLAKDGMDFSMKKMHPDFLQSALIMQQEGINFLHNTNNCEAAKVIVHLEGVYKKATGKYFHFLQQAACLDFDATGHPYLFLSYIHDVSYMKKCGTANLVITTPHQLQWWNFNYDKNCLEPLRPLSNQEKKILSFLAEGKSSKAIAAELSISPHTIDTHRRNLLEKTNCIDTTGLITYGRLVGLL